MLLSFFYIKITLNYVSILRPYRTVTTPRLGYKTSQLVLYRETIAVCSQIHTKHIIWILYKDPVRTAQ
jgi:hypothetical protein